MQKITPCLWFNGNAADAMEFYSGIFSNTKIISEAYYGETGPGKKGTLLTAIIELEGERLMLLNGGPQYQFTPAVSFMISCEGQDEVDHLWNKLSAGGREDRCGWLQDRFGLSWQVVPTALPRMLQDKDAAKREAVMQAMLQMKKIIIADLQAAYDAA